MRLLPIVASLLLAQPAQGRTLVDLDLPLAGQSPAAAALAAVQARAELLGARRPALVVSRVHAIEGGQVVRIEQRHAGLRVLGAEVAVTIQRGRIVALSGRLHDLASLDTSPAGLIPAQAAMAAATVEQGGRARHAELAIWPWTRERVWLVDSVTTNPFGLFRSLLSARDGKVLWRRSTIQPLAPQVLGRVYRHNPKQGPLLDLPLLGLADPAVLAGAHADVKSCTASQTSLDCTRNAKPVGGHFLFAPSDPDFSDAFAEVQAYHHVDAFHRFLQRRFEFSRQGKQQIAVFVNLASVDKSGKLAGYPNAFFGDLDGDGQGDLAFGQSARDFAYDGDVVYHEFAHSAVSETSGLEPEIDELGFNAMPLGLNEGFADLLSSFYTGDPIVGEYAGGGGGIRNLVGTASCPASLTGESHSDGLIWSRAVWAIRARQHRPEAFEAVLYKTMVGLTLHAGLSDAASLLQKLAALHDPALGAEVAQELKLRGVDTCGRIVPLAPGQTLKGYILGRYYLPGLPVAPGPLQYRIDVPADAVQLDLELTGALSMNSKTANAGAYIRRDLPVAYGTKVSYDLAKPSNLSVLSLTLADAKNRLEPGASYYVLPVNEGSYETTYAIQVTLTHEEVEPPPPPLAPDGGVAPPASVEPPATPAAPAKGAATEASAVGCACHPGTRPEVLSLPLLLLLALRLRPHRRAR